MRLMDNTEFSNKLNYVRSLGIGSVLSHFNVKYGKRLDSKTDVYYCPWHKDVHSPNLCVNKVKNMCNCFRCNTGGDSITVAGRLIHGKGYINRGPEFINVVDRLYTDFYGIVQPFVPQRVEEETFDLTVRDIKVMTRSISDKSKEYIFNRGITEYTRFNIGEVSRWNGPYVTRPHFHEGELVGCKYRRNDLASKEGLRYFTVPGSKTHLPHDFSHPAGSVVFLVEDSFSAMSIASLGFPSVSLFSGNIIQDEGRKEFYKLLSNKKIIAIPDNDEAGDNLLDSVVDCGLTLHKVHRLNSYKDFNELLENNRSSAYKLLLETWGTL
jgi:hypothetical protein